MPTGQPRMITAHGKTQTASGWAKELGLSHQRICVLADMAEAGKLSMDDAMTKVEPKQSRSGNKGGRPPIIIKAFGEEKTIAEWAESQGLTYNQLHKRIRAVKDGRMTVEQALTRKNGERAK